MMHRAFVLLVLLTACLPSASAEQVDEQLKIICYDRHPASTDLQEQCAREFVQDVIWLAGFLKRFPSATKSNNNESSAADAYWSCSDRFPANHYFFARCTRLKWLELTHPD
jgi:hypothetical protein